MSKTFKSFVEAGDFFSRAALVQERVGQAALEKAGKAILEKAQGKFGHYQRATGEWARWMPLTQYTRDERVGLGYSEDEPLLRSGELRDSVTLSTEHGRIVIGSADIRMIWHEFGTTHMPPRAVLGPALYEMRNKVIKSISHAIIESSMYGFVKEEDL